MSKEILEILRTRFEENLQRHPGLDWNEIRARLEANPRKLWSLQEMERTGGEPDDGKDPATGYISVIVQRKPPGRRNVCFDRKGQMLGREGVYPQAMLWIRQRKLGFNLTPEQYRELQKLGSFDQETSSWLQTPEDIRELGGHCLRPSLWACVYLSQWRPVVLYVRGFRGILRV